MVHIHLPLLDDTGLSTLGRGTESTQNEAGIDSTAQHLINKMLEMRWKKVHPLNLYSMVAQQKPKAGDLKNVDRENLAYIGKILSSANAKAKVTIGWGNSLQSNRSANESKLVLLEGLAGEQMKASCGRL